jgi:hypothetical protein
MSVFNFVDASLKNRSEMTAKRPKHEAKEILTNSDGSLSDNGFLKTINLNDQLIDCLPILEKCSRPKGVFHREVRTKSCPKSRLLQKWLRLELADVDRVTRQPKNTMIYIYRIELTKYGITLSAIKIGSHIADNF